MSTHRCCRQSVAVMLLVAGIAVVCADHAWSADPPNIVILLADDLGWNAVGYHNREFQTPHIDALVQSGVELDRFYVAPMCSPTRAGLMTGRYPIRFGLARAVIPPQRDFGLPVRETTLGEVLKRLGYKRRGVFGKWHLGHRRSKWHPLKQGFTRFHGHYNGAIDYFRLTRENERDWHTDYETSTQQGYATDLIAAAAAEFIQEAAREDAPYFCYVPFNAPHSPFQAPADAIEKFGGQAEDGKSGRKKRNRVIYQAMVWQMDQGIGRILDAVRESGEAHNTLVLFFSDNGGVGGLRDLNTPLRGSKLTVYEGGIRVPACISWPARLQPGERSHDVFGYIDVFPTLVAAAGYEAGPLVERPLDGVNMLPVLEGIGKHPVWTKVAERPWFSYHGQGGEQTEHISVTQRGWKLKVNGPRLRGVRQLGDGTNRVELFHLSEDPHEQTDLSAAMPDRVRQMGRLLVRHRTQQPPIGVPRYSVGKQGFVPPKDWKLDPRFPDRLVGTDTRGDQ